METKKRILLVDDEKINREFFEVMLTKLDFETQKDDNGIDALELVKIFKPDLIMLDNVMLRLSGWEVTKIIKAHEDYHKYAETPIIMFSTMDDVKDKVEVLARIRAVLRTCELIGQIEERKARIRIVEAISERVLGFTLGPRAPLLDIAAQAAVAELDALDSAISDLKPIASRARRPPCTSSRRSTVAILNNDEV